MGNANGTSENMGYEPEDIAGKAVVVTGGTTGIGRAIARLLAIKGAKTLITGLDEAHLNDALADIKKVATGEIHGLIADSSKPEDVQKIIREAEWRLGGLDVLVNNAALGGGGIMDSDYDQWRRIVETNILGYMICAKAAVEKMKEKGQGHLVNIGSMSAKVREAGSDVYVATKSAIEGFSDSLAKTVNEQGIKITCIEPGLVGSDMTTDQVKAEEQDQKIEAMKMMKAEDLAHCVHYCITQPQRVDIALVHIRPLKQII